MTGTREDKESAPASRLVELIGEDRLLRILQGFSAATGASVIALDERGQRISGDAGRCYDWHNPTPLCSQLIWDECGLAAECSQRDRRAAEEAAAMSGPYLFRCPLTGLWEFSVAVRVAPQNEVIGYLFGGQMADEEKKREGRFYRERASELGVDPDRFLSLLDESVAVSPEVVRAHATVLAMLASDLATIAQQQQRAEAFRRAALAIGAGRSLSLPDVLEQILSQVDALLHPDESAVWLLDRKNGDRLIAARTHNGLPAFMGEGEQPFFRLKAKRPQEIGMIGQVALGQFPEIVEDLETHLRDAKYPQAITRMGIRGLMAVRIPKEGPLLGVLEVGSKQKGRYTEADLHGLEVFGNYMAAAIRNAQLYDDLQHQLARVVPEKDAQILRQRALLAMHDAFAPGVDRSGVLRLLLRHTLGFLRRSFDIDVSGHARLVDPHTGDAILCDADTALGLGSSAIPQVRPKDDPLTGSVVYPGETVYLPDVRQSPQFLAQREALSDPVQLELHELIQSLLVLPVWCGRQVGGLLTVYTTGPGGISDDARHVVGRLCEVAGMALANAADRDQMAASADLRRRLEVIGARLAGIGGRRQIVQAAAGQARDIVGGRCAVLMCLLPIADGEDLEVQWISGPSDYPGLAEREELVGARIPNNTALSAVLARGDVVLIDSDNDVRYRFQLPGTRSALLAAMRYRYGKALEGMIAVESRSTRPFSDVEVEGMRLMASQTAVHVQRTRALAEDYAAFVHHFSRPMSLLYGFSRQCARLAAEDTLPNELARIAEAAQGTWEVFRAYEAAFRGLDDFAPESVRVADLVEDVIQLVRREVTGRTLTADYVGGCDSAQILVDIGATKGALLELINNAIASDPGNAPIQVVCRAHGDLFRIEVHDAGAPISEAECDHLFDLRTPIGRTGNEAAGIGLWIVRSVVKRQGGEVHVEWPGATPKALVISLPLVK
jgi:GAF domain-containing protein/ligand-binding sensor protein